MKDTIAAISTAYGRGGVALIRISGDEAISIAERVFSTASGKNLGEIPSNLSVYGNIIKGGKKIDDGICTVFRSPRSYTGEDTAEICCHGGIILTETVLEAVYEAGAVPAGPGEFTKRAFINGKLSLSQAEAVGMIIDAESKEQLALASSHQSGVMKKKSDELYERLKTVVTGVYANVDFPDEDLAELSSDEVLRELTGLSDELTRLKSSYKVGRAVLEGIPTVLAGKPNTGKSSLLNRLVGHERAIVTDVAGTTRDTIEETVSCGRILLRLCDTAGIRETADKVEKIGVERSVKNLEKAELILAVFDLSRPFDRDDERLIKHIKNTNGTKIAVLNKNDLTQVLDEELINGSGIFAHTVYLNASSEDDFKNGVEELKELIGSLYIAGEIDYSVNAVVTNARQNLAVSNALACIERARAALASGLSTDTAGFDLEEALSELSELDGRRVTEEIVDGIFHRFCVGK